MSHVKTSLVRERFVVQDLDNGKTGTSFDEDARSNRIEVPYHDKSGVLIEKIIVRTHTMHTAVRLAARIAQAHTQDGPIRHRGEPFDWEEAWYQVTEPFERSNNPDSWAAVYHNGDILFHHAKHHPLLDIIEKCEVYNKRDYDYAVQLAEKSFQKLEKNVKIDYDSNIAMVMQSNKDKGRCGIIFRHAERTTTFQVNLDAQKDFQVNATTCLNVCAAFLEGIQLAFRGGFLKNKIAVEDLKISSDEARSLTKILERMKQLNIELRTSEKINDIHYRPERPDFFDLLDETRLIFLKQYEEEVAKQKEQEKLEEMALQEELENEDGDTNLDEEEERVASND